MNKGIKVISSNGYRPPRTNDRCVVCGSGNMIDSPEGLTCGENICRDHLLEKWHDIIIVSKGDFEEKISGAMEKIDNSTKEMEDIKKAIADVEERINETADAKIKILEGLKKELKEVYPFF